MADLDEKDRDVIAEVDTYFNENRETNAKKNAGDASADPQSGGSEFAKSSNFDNAGGGSSDAAPETAAKSKRPRLSQEELDAANAEHKRDIETLTSQRTEDDTKLIETLKGYLVPYGYLPVATVVTRNDSRLSAKLVNRIPASKRQFAAGVPDNLKAGVDKNNIPAHLAAAEYDITFFESNPGPLLGVFAYLPRNFETAVLETLSTATSKSKINGWSKADGPAAERILRWVSKEELLNIMVATAAPAVFVEEGKEATRSPKNLEFFYKRMQDTETGATWYNLISRDTATGKARKGTSAGFIPLNTYVQETPKSGEDLQIVSNQMLGGPLFNAPTKQGKPIANRYEELTSEARALLSGNTRETFVLNDIKAAQGVKAIGHTNRKDAPSNITMKPAKVEKYTTTNGADKTRFVKVNFVTCLENAGTSLFNKDYISKVQANPELLSEAQKRKAKTSQSSLIEQKNKTAATNELLNGTIPSLGKKKTKK